MNEVFIVCFILCCLFWIVVFVESGSSDYYTVKDSPIEKYIYHCPVCKDIVYTSNQNPICKFDDTKLVKQIRKD